MRGVEVGEEQREEEGGCEEDLIFVEVLSEEIEDSFPEELVGFEGDHKPIVAGEEEPLGGKAKHFGNFGGVGEAGPQLKRCARVVANARAYL